MKHVNRFVSGLLIGLVSTAVTLGGGGWSCLTSGTTTACPVGTNCTYLYSDNCYTGDEVGESAGSYHSCGGWGCGAQAECNGFAGGFACKCFMKDTCP